MTPPRSPAIRERAKFALALTLITVCFLFGGASRLDVPGLAFLQPAAVLIGAALLIIPGPMRWDAVRAPLFFIGALAMLMAAQLVPLPPAVWQALPGHGQFVPFLAEAGVANAWRPMSLAPDLTLASLVSLTVPLTAILVFASLSEERSHRLLIYVLVATAVSALFGIGQLTGTAERLLYRYAVTNEGAAVGLFANRNHQALLLAMAWPMLAVWLVGNREDDGRAGARLGIAAAAAIALVPLTIASGSRGGLGLAAIGVALAAWIVWRRRETLNGIPLPRGISPRAAFLAVAAVSIAVLAATLLSSRDEAVSRLANTDVGGELRVQFLPLILRITGDFLPFGTGFGSFDPVFRFYEPESLVAPFYVNHAHNDWVELVFTGGIFAALLAVAFGVWAVRKAWRARVWELRTRHQRFGFMGLGIIGLALIASGVDYPLRTPIHSLLLAFAAAWLAGAKPARPAP